MTNLINVAFIAVMVGYAWADVGKIPTNCGPFPWYMPLLVLAIMGFPAILGYVGALEDQRRWHEMKKLTQAAAKNAVVNAALARFNEKAAEYGGNTNYMRAVKENKTLTALGRELIYACARLSRSKRKPRGRG